MNLFTLKINILTERGAVEFDDGREALCLPSGRDIDFSPRSGSMKKPSRARRPI
jgi:hypothetical protein